MHPAKQVQFAGISWLVPSVKSHHARLCNHPVDNARSMGFLEYGGIGLFGFMNRRGSAFGHGTYE